MRLKTIPCVSLAAALAALAGMPDPASAQDGPGADIDLQGFRPAMDSRGFLTVNGSEVLPASELSFGLVTTWGRRLLRFESGDSAYEVRHMITPTLLGAVGLSPLGLDLELGASLPFAVMSGGREPDFDHPDPNMRVRHRFEGQGIGDAGLHLKWRLVDGSRAPMGLAVIGSAYLPTASRQSWLGSGRLVPQALAVADREAGRLRMALSGGIRHAPRAVFRDDQPVDPGGMAPPPTGGSISVGSSIPFGAALSYAVVPARFEAVGEVFGALPLQGQSHLPLEAAVGIKLYLAESSFLTLGGGSGLLRSQGASPDLRAFVGIVFEPRSRDLGAGRLDSALGSCPHGPDGVGCVDPAPEEDEEELADLDEPCPDGELPFEDGGCPDRDIFRDLEVTSVILREIHFEFDSAILKQDSHPILRVIAESLESHTDIRKVEVQGHTDERGPAAYNLDLSQRRAQAVVDFLIGEGIDPARLEAVGHGETVPIDPEQSEEAWAKNRRVEFVILERW